MRDLLNIVETYLIEYKRDITLQKYGIALNLAGEKDRGYTADQIISVLEQLDPTSHKEYTQWLVKMYVGGNLKLEDVNRNNLLTKFNELKVRKKLQPQHRDINSFRTYKQFEDVIIDNYSDVSQKLVNKGQSETVYDGPEVRIVVPKDEAAACYYGQGTRWCTASIEGENYFDHYNSKGIIYILLPKTPSYHGEKYQIHFEDSQIKDEADEDVSLNSLMNKYPTAFDQYFGVRLGHVIFMKRDTVNRLSQLYGSILTELLKILVERSDSTKEEKLEILKKGEKLIPHAIDVYKIASRYLESYINHIDNVDDILNLTIKKCISDRLYNLTRHLPYYAGMLASILISKKSPNSTEVSSWISILKRNKHED